MFLLHTNKSRGIDMLAFSVTGSRRPDQMIRAYNELRCSRPGGKRAETFVFTDFGHMGLHSPKFVGI